PRSDPGRVWALLLSGGAERNVNYQSHVIHLESMVGWLERSGVPAEHITIFASDGEDPGADLAVRELRPKGEVDLLDGTNLEPRLGRPIEYKSTHIEGFRVRPATRTALEVWFDTVGREIKPGDTLLFYVTDHGMRGKTGPEDTRIALWGRKEVLT